MADLIGQHLGRYEILSVLGEGGMATVYRARQMSVNREVALKVIKRDMSSTETFTARFSREAEMIAQLSHPNILKLFDYGQEGEITFLVMELLSGGTLHEMLQQGALPLVRAYRLFGQIASALDYAHKQGIIHRDLKPQNVMLDAHGNAYLTDFGLARLTDTTRITQTGITMGTPAYMSPEAWQGEGLDYRSDLYSLGVMLYEMLTGDLPFQSDSPYQMMMAHVNEMPPHISLSTAKFSPKTDGIIQKALAKNPSDRPSSAMAIASALHNILPEDEGLATAQIEIDRPPSTLKAVAQPTSQDTKITTQTDKVVPPKPGRRIGSAIIGAAVVIFLVVIVLITQRKSPSTDVPKITSSDVVQVAPVATDENMVLVAQLEQLGKQPRDVGRFISADLTDTLDTSLPFSKLRIREYPKVISSPEQALAAAKANHAWVIVWGSVDDNQIDLRVQVGDLGVLKHNKIPEDVVRRYTDVQIRLTDPRTQSVAIPVIAILDSMQSADGNSYETQRIMSLLNQLKTTVSTAEVVGNSGAAQIDRALLLFMGDTQNFVGQMQPIIDLDPSNPLPYLYRSIGYIRLHQNDLGLQDLETSKRLGPVGWTLPLFLIAVNSFLDKDYPAAITGLNQVLQANPADWYALTIRSIAYFLSGNIDQAKEDIDKVIASKPNSNAPYTVATLLAMHQGRIGEAKKFINIILTAFPDPSYTERIVEAVFGDPSTSKFAIGLMISISNNLFLAQYDRVLKDTDTALKIDSSLPDLYLAQGFANCNLSKWADAEKSYTKGITLDPNYAVLYALRAEVRSKLGNLVGAFGDIQAMRKIKGSEELTALITNTASGGASLSCQNFFTSIATPTVTP